MHIVESSSFFKAVYNYGPQGQEVEKINLISKSVNSLAVKLLEIFIYPGASVLKRRLIDMNKIENARNQLLLIGGQSVRIETPDADKIDGMYLSAFNFKNNLEKYFNVIEKDDEGGTVRQVFRLKPEFCEIKKDSIGSMKPNKEAKDYMNNLKKLGVGFWPNNPHNPGSFSIDLIPQNTPMLQREGSHPTVLIAPAAGMSYAAYKKLAIAYLFNGISVMLIDFRGYGKSEGSPTEIKTKLDLDAAYQYLQTQHGIKNEHLIVHGHSLGAGPACDLAARRSGVSLIIDRSFAQYKDVAEKFNFGIFFNLIGDSFSIKYKLLSIVLKLVTKIKNLVVRVIPSIVNYNNAENISKVKGHLAIVMATRDRLIPEEQIDKLIDHLPNTRPGQIVKLLNTEGEHSGAWISATDYTLISSQFSQFLDQTHLRSKLF